MQKIIAKLQKLYPNHKIRIEGNNVFIGQVRTTLDWAINRKEQ